MYPLVHFNLPDILVNLVKCVCLYISCSVMSNSLQSHKLQLIRLLRPCYFPRQGKWRGQSFPSPGDLPNPGIEFRSPALQAASLPSAPPGRYVMEPLVHLNLPYILVNLVKSHLKYAFLLKFSYVTPFGGDAGTWWPESLVEGKRVFRESLWGLSRTPGEALAMKWNRVAGRPSLPLC